MFHTENQKILDDRTHLRTRSRYTWDKAAYKTSWQSNHPFTMNDCVL